jgi:dinuclear metal center YbgI/SA1388 family protein
MPTLSDLLAVLDRAYPARLAESWDSGVGLTCGDPAATVRAVLLAVDVDAAVVAEAEELGVDVLLTHHPLLFRPVQSVAANTPKGRLLHRLIRAGIAHVAAHTNADRAVGGVNDALAEALGLRDMRPLVPAPGAPLDKIVSFVPVADAAGLVAALAAVGAGRIGDYTEAAFTLDGVGQFRPGPGANPTIGTVGALEQVPETRIEMMAPRALRRAVVAALRAAHPYEEPAFDVVELVSPDQPGTGLGRVGRLPAPMTLAAFAEHVAARLPATAAGVRAGGDPQRMITVVAVCGGAGDGELDAAAAAGADAYLTSDLRHHVAAEHLADPGRPALVDVAHWAGEWPWLQRAADMITAELPGSVSVTVSQRSTDPWTVHRCAPTEARR